MNRQPDVSSFRYTLILSCGLLLIFAGLYLITYDKIAEGVTLPERSGQGVASR